MSAASTPPPSSAIALEPRVLAGRYRLDARIGEGGMGLVYRGVDLALERAVAVKLTRGEPEAQAAAASRFLREVKSAAKIRDEHVIEVFDVGQDEGGELFYVMELLAGESLGRRLEREGRLDAAAAVHIAAQICQALDAAHQGGVIHRDLKPANVMLVHRGRDDAFVKLIDFGISKAEGAVTRPTRAGEIVGTIGYMAPEQIRGEGIDGRTDLYALGVLLYRALTGSDVFEDRGLPAAVHDHLETAPTPLRERAPGADVPEALESVVLRCLAKRPADRFDSASTLAAALTAAVSPEHAMPLEMIAPNGPVPSDAPPAPRSDPDAAVHFELADVPPRATASATPGPRVCALCGSENQRYAPTCSGCGDSLDSPEQIEFRARAPLALSSSLAPLMPSPRSLTIAQDRSLGSLPMTAKLRLATHATVALLFVNAWFFGFGALSSLLFLASLVVWINVFLGPLKRRIR